MREAAKRAREQMLSVFDVDEDMAAGLGIRAARRPRRDPNDADFRPGGGGGGVASYTKRRRCGECAGCKAPNCGHCTFCLDMPCFGGSGTMRQSCKNRMCEVIASELAEIAEEKAKVREGEREKRQAERDVQQAEKDAKRAAAAAARSQVVRLTGQAPSRSGPHTAALATARAPTVRLDPNLTGGWGMFCGGAAEDELAAGDRVEVLMGSEQGVEGDSYWTGAVGEPAAGGRVRRRAATCWWLGEVG